jgi:hypothetical protein
MNNEEEEEEMISGGILGFQARIQFYDRFECLIHGRDQSPIIILHVL